MQLDKQILAAAAWAAGQEAMPLHRNGSMWALVREYVRELVERNACTVAMRGPGKSHMHVLPCGPGPTSCVLGYGGGADQASSPAYFVVMHQSAAEAMWQRLLTLAVASPTELTQDAAVARALFIGSRGDSASLVPVPAYQTDVWCSIMYNTDLLGVGTDAAKHMANERMRRLAQRGSERTAKARAARAQKAQDTGVLSFAAWSARIDAEYEAHMRLVQVQRASRTTDDDNDDDGGGDASSADAQTDDDGDDDDDASASADGTTATGSISSVVGKRYRHHVGLEWRVTSVPLHESSWHLVRASAATYLACAHVLHEADATASFVACKPGQAAQLAKLALNTPPDRLLLVAKQIKARQFAWPVDGQRVQQLFERTLCAVHDRAQANGASPRPAKRQAVGGAAAAIGGLGGGGGGVEVDVSVPEIVWRIMASPYVTDNGWAAAESRVREALPAWPVLARMCGQMYGFPALLAALHARSSVRPRQVLWWQCTAVDTLAPALQLANDFDMPGQRRAVYGMQAAFRSERLVCVQARDSERARPTALQLAASVRAVQPEARHGLDFVTVGGCWPDSGQPGPRTPSPVVLVLRPALWRELSIGETARTRAVAKHVRWTDGTAEVLLQALQHCPARALDALRIMMRVPSAASGGGGEEPVVVTLRRLDRALQAFASTADRLVDVLWASLDRGPGDALWTVLETCLFPGRCSGGGEATATWLTVRQADEAARPVWLSPAQWQAFFDGNRDRPGNLDNAWPEAVARNRKTGRSWDDVLALHGQHLPASVASDVRLSQAEDTKATAAAASASAADLPAAWSVAGVPASTKAAGLVTSFWQGDGVIRMASAAAVQQQTTAATSPFHLQLLDAALDAIHADDTPAAVRADALRWLRNVRASRPLTRTGAGRSSSSRFLVRLPGNSAPPVRADDVVVSGQSRLLEQRYRSSIGMPPDDGVLARLKATPVSVRTLVMVLPAVVTAWARRRRSQDRARRLAYMYVHELSQQRSHGSDCFAVMPVRPADTVGTLAECTALDAGAAAAAAAGGDDASCDGSVAGSGGGAAAAVAPVAASRFLATRTVLRPFVDMLPGAIEGVLSNFYWGPTQ